MGGPGGQGLKVVRSELDNAARIWESQASAIGSITQKANGLRFNGRIEAGVFQLIVGPYGDVVKQVGDRCSEGQQDMGDISRALSNASAAYAKTEAQNTQNARSVH